MECREWQGAPGREFLGTYIFSLDDKGELSVVQKPEGPFNALFGRNVNKWTLLKEEEGHAVFYGITDDSFGPVKILSLNFGSPKMFDYSLGGITEEKSLEKPLGGPTRKECKRIN
jgi:hypothetical protein